MSISNIIPYYAKENWVIFNSDQEITSKFSHLFSILSIQNISKSETNEILRLLKTGQDIAFNLLNIHASLPFSSKENALALTWFIMASAFEEGEVFVRGTVRLQLSQELSIRFKHFLANCNESYNRPSSHFNEMKIGNNKGINFKGQLPLDPELGTVLFNRLNDGTFYIKLETKGLRISNPIDSLLHMKNLYKHIKSKGGEKVVNGLPTHRETDGQEVIKEAFNSVISEWKKVNRSVNIKHELKSNNRIFKMHKKVVEINQIFTKQDGSHYKTLRSSIRKFQETIAEIKQPSVISGSEILVDLRRYLK